MIGDALEVGVGGFWIVGGNRAEVAELTQELHRRSRRPLLIGAEVDGGAGSAFSDATGLPPLAALAALRDADVIRRAAKLTAREMRSLGVNWALGPVGDLEREPSNPFLGARSFGLDAQRAAEYVVEWVDAVQAEGVLACVRHYPGMGRAPLRGPGVLRRLKLCIPCVVDTIENSVDHLYAAWPERILSPAGPAESCTPASRGRGDLNLKWSNARTDRFLSMV